MRVIINLKLRVKEPSATYRNTYTHDHKCGTATSTLGYANSVSAMTARSTIRAEIVRVCAYEFVCSWDQKRALAVKLKPFANFLLSHHISDSEAVQRTRTLDEARGQHTTQLRVQARNDDNVMTSLSVSRSCLNAICHQLTAAIAQNATDAIGRSPLPQSSLARTTDEFS